jgi:hypothetical protein
MVMTTNGETFQGKSSDAQFGAKKRVAPSSK